MGGAINLFFTNSHWLSTKLCKNKANIRKLSNTLNGSPMNTTASVVHMLEQGNYIAQPWNAIVFSVDKRTTRKYPW
jgi:hypothetical protein